MKKLFIWLNLLLILIIVPAEAAQPLKIGFIGPLTGSFANVGNEAKQVLTMLLTDINEQGGLLGRKVEMIFENETDPTAAARLAQQKVAAVIGPHISDRTRSVQNIFNDAGIIHVSYGSTAISLTEQGLPYFFRTCPRDDEQAKAFVRIVRKLNLKKIALLNDESLYGQGLAAAIDDQLHAWMIDTVYRGSLKSGGTDYLDILKKIRAAAPDIVFFAGYYPEAARLLQGKHQLQWNVSFIGGDGVNNPELIGIAGKKAADGFYFLSPPNPEHLEIPTAIAFLSRFQKAYQQKLSSIYPLLAGNAFIAFTETVMQIQTTAAPAVADYLHRQYFNKSGLTGEIFFNVWGDVVNDLYAVYQVDENGRFILKRQILHGDFIQ